MVRNNFNIGIIGVGHLGKHHVKHLKTIKSSNLVGIFDLNHKQASIISNEYGVDNFKSQLNLIEKSDGISIVTPTKSHFKIAKLCLNHGIYFLNSTMVIRFSKLSLKKFIQSMIS